MSTPTTTTEDTTTATPCEVCQTPTSRVCDHLVPVCGDCPETDGCWGCYADQRPGRSAA